VADFMNMVMNLSTPKGSKLLLQLNNYQLLKEGPGNYLLLYVRRPQPQIRYSVAFPNSEFGK